MTQDSSETVLNAEVVVLNKHGLHLSCASRLARLASGFSCSLSLSNGKRVADAKSMLGLVTLAASSGSRLKVSAKGVDAEDALSAIVAYFSDYCGESCGH